MNFLVIMAGTGRVSTSPVLSERDLIDWIIQRGAVMATRKAVHQWSSDVTQGPVYEFEESVVFVRVLVGKDPVMYKDLPMGSVFTLRHPEYPDEWWQKGMLGSRRVNRDGTPHPNEHDYGWAHTQPNALCWVAED